MVIIEAIAIAIERRIVLPIVVHFELSAPPVPSQAPNHAPKLPSHLSRSLPPGLPQHITFL